MTSKRRKVPAKVVTLDNRIWIKQGIDLTKYRTAKLKEQKGKCAVTGAKITTGVLDHAHEDCENPYQEDGRVRGVLASDVNMLEGRFLRLFKRARIGEKYNISFPDFLINLGNYLRIDNSENKFHFKYMDDLRKRVKTWLKDDIILRLKDDFGIVASEKMDKSMLVQMYVQAWVKEVEESY